MDTLENLRTQVLADVEQAASLEALEAVRVAFEIELGGRAFYARAAEEAPDPEMRDLFAKLAVMEEAHMTTLSRRYHLDTPEPCPDFKIVRAAVFAGIDSQPEDPANLFRIAIAFEERAAGFFAGRSLLAQPGTPEHALFQELAAEEREHVAVLTTEYERWKAGKPGLL